jgi:hypothetical protein
MSDITSDIIKIMIGGCLLAAFIVFVVLVILGIVERRHQ